MFISEPVGVPEAAATLGVSTARVRQLIREQQLPAGKVGGVWIMPHGNVSARAELKLPAERPLSQRNAWQAINAAEIDPMDGVRYQRRGRTTRWQRGTSVPVEAVRELNGMVSGTWAAIEFLERVIHCGVGIPQPGFEHDVYLPWSQLQSLIDLTGWLPSGESHSVIRFVDDDVWDVATAAAVPSTRHSGLVLAPPAAAALDLALHSGPRSHDAGFALMTHKEEVLNAL